MINWPAVLAFDGDDELVFVESERALYSEAEALLYNHEGNDCLIDGSGRLYQLTVTDDRIGTEYTGEQITLQAFVRLVRIHASNSHRCCIEKIGFRTIEEGIKLVGDMNGA